VPALLAGPLARDVRGVFLEGGPTLAGSFVAAGLIDRVIAYIAPALLGAGRTGLVDAGITTMDDILRPETLDVRRGIGQTSRTSGPGCSRASRVSKRVR
jgi:diaminohydroxyphosphoribosylaminopyrimidine deaminase/5-amino-6-(5-phosphoribosylamino)uracil reductase